MPELPEVETIRGQLEREIIGDSIVSIDVYDRLIFVGDEKSAAGESVTHVSRAGKYLFIHFASGRGLGLHLKMTGRLILGLSVDQQFGSSVGELTREPELNYYIAEHTRARIYLSSGRVLHYWDTRKFGFIKVVEDIREAVEKTKKHLGPEPWELDPITFLRKLQKTGRAIKDVLLDQIIVAGIGNIYANDALFHAGILPIRKAHSIGLKEAGVLLESLKAVLDRGLATGGASDNTYRDLYGNKGSYQNEFLVYGKTKGVCPQCERELVYTKIGGRGTWYCGKCQN